MSVIHPAAAAAADGDNVVRMTVLLKPSSHVQCVSDTSLLLRNEINHIKTKILQYDTFHRHFNTHYIQQAFSSPISTSTWAATYYLDEDHPR